MSTIDKNLEIENIKKFSMAIRKEIQCISQEPDANIEKLNNLSEKMNDLEEQELVAISLVRKEKDENIDIQEFQKFKKFVDDIQDLKENIEQDIIELKAILEQYRKTKDSKDIQQDFRELRYIIEQEFEEIQEFVDDFQDLKVSNQNKHFDINIQMCEIQNLRDVVDKIFI